MEQFIAADTETTGLHIGARPVEFASVLFDQTGVLDTFESLINPQCPIPEQVSKIHGISSEMVADAPTFDVVMRNFFDWMESHDCRTFVMHNAPYDVGIVSWEAARCGVGIPSDYKVIDTTVIARSVKATKNNKLITLIDHYGIERRGNAHRAFSDAAACADYFNLIQPSISIVSPAAWGSLVPYTYTDDLPEFLSDLPELVRDGTPLSIRYVDKEDRETERTVTPWGWGVTKNGIALMEGFCHLRNEMRPFIFDRIAARMASEEPNNATV